MRTDNGNSNATEEHTILARAAFGRESCVKLERNGRGTWLQVGKKSGEAWDWKKAKLSDVEIAELLLVLELRQEQAGFFHKFNGNETRISVARFAGRQITDTILDSKDYYGRLMDIIDRAEQYVKGHYDIMQKLVEGQAATQPIHQYPPWAVRELIVNAVCHRDYSDYGSRIMVFMLRDRIEFHSPGGFPAGITARNVLGKQFTRNPVIARVLHDAGYIEQFGSGLDRVFGEAREHPLKPKLPTIAADAGQVVVTLHSPEEFLAAPPGEAVPVPLSSRQEKILAYVREHREINSLLCEKELGIPQRTAHRELQEMVGKGVLVALGERRGRRYRVANNG